MEAAQAGQVEVVRFLLTRLAMGWCSICVDDADVQVGVGVDLQGLVGQNNIASSNIGRAGGAARRGGGHHLDLLLAQVEVVRALLAASNEVAQVDTRDWKNNHILDDVKEGEIKKMVLLRIARLEDEQGLNEQGPELSREEFNVEHSAKEVREIQEGLNYNKLEILMKPQMLKMV